MSKSFHTKRPNDLESNWLVVLWFLKFNHAGNQPSIGFVKCSSNLPVTSWLAFVSVCCPSVPAFAALAAARAQWPVEMSTKAEMGVGTRVSTWLMTNWWLNHLLQKWSSNYISTWNLHTHTHTTLSMKSSQGLGLVCDEHDLLAWSFTYVLCAPKLKTLNLLFYSRSKVWSCPVKDALAIKCRINIMSILSFEHWPRFVNAHPWFWIVSPHLHDV